MKWLARHQRHFGEHASAARYRRHRLDRSAEPPTLAISVVTLAELRNGVSDHASMTPRRADRLDHEPKCSPRFARRILPITDDILMAWLRLIRACARGVTQERARSAHRRNRTNTQSDRRHPQHSRLRQHRHNGLQSLDQRNTHNGSAVNIVTQPGSLAGETNRKRVARPLRRDRRRALRHHRSRDAGAVSAARCATSITATPRWCCGRARSRRSRRSSSSPTRRRRRSCRRAATPASSAGRSRITARSSSRSTAWTRSARWTRRRTPSRRRPAFRSGACARRLPMSTGSIRCCCRPKAPARSAAISRPTRAAPRRSPGASRASRRSGSRSCSPTGACSTISTS